MARKDDEARERMRALQKEGDATFADNIEDGKGDNK